LVMYETVTGRKPFADVIPLAEAAKRLKENPPSPKSLVSTLDPKWDSVILRCLAIKPENRFASVRDVLPSLSTATSQSSPFLSTVSTFSKLKPIKRLLISSAFGLLLLIALSIKLILRPPVHDSRAGITGPPAGEENSATRSSIVVLPFSDLTGQKAFDFVAEGLTDELITSLTNVDGIRVVSRISSFSFKDTNLSLRDIADKLKVGYLVQGAVYKQGDNLRINVNLIAAADDRNMWSNTYEGNVNDMNRLHAQIAKAIVELLRGRLTNDQVAQLGKQYTLNTDAYRLYLRGRLHWRRLTPEEINKSIAYFKQAIELDDRFALAYAGLADAYSALSDYGGLTPSVAIAKARLAAEQAVRLDESLAEAHASLGLAVSLSVQPWQDAHGLKHNWTEAEASFLRAIRLSPGYGPAHQWYAAYLAKEGRLREAISEIRFALDRDPISIPVNNVYGWMLFFDRQYDLAIKQAEQTLDLDKTFRHSHLLLARIYEQQGRFDMAIAECRISSPQDDDTSTPSSVLGGIYAATGRKQEALKIVAELTARRASEHFPASYVASIYSRLGDRENAFKWIRTAYNENDSSVLFVRVHPDYDGLRSDPQYSALLQELHLNATEQPH
jgi:adenylate cyclase